MSNCECDSCTLQTGSIDVTPDCKPSMLFPNTNSRPTTFAYHMTCTCNCNLTSSNFDTVTRSTALRRTLESMHIYTFYFHPFSVPHSLCMYIICQQVFIYTRRNLAASGRTNTRVRPLSTPPTSLSKR